MLEDIFELYPKGMAILSKDKIMIHANKLFLEQLIYRKEEVIGKDFYNLLPNDISNIEKEQLNDLFTNKLSHIFLELYLLNGLKHKILSRITVEHILDKNKKIDHFVLLVEHIFLEKQSNETEHPELLWKVMFENNQAVKLLINPSSGYIIEANSAACKYYGYNYESLIKMNISEINILPEKSITEEMDKAKKEKRNYFNFKHRLSNAEIRDVEVWSSPIHYLGQKILYSVVHDVTEKKKAEEELKKSEENYRLLIENQNDLIVKLNENFKILYVNPAYCRLFNQSESNLIGKVYFPFESNSDPSILLNIRKMEFEKKYFNDNGEIWILWSCKVSKNRENNKTEIVTVGRIITDLKHAEEELIELNQTLEKRVKERTIQLEEINTELESFSYSVSHDLRTPLRSIGGFSEILYEDYAESLDEQAKEYLSHIIKSTRKMEHLIAELLNLSRLTRKEVLLGQLNLSELLESIILSIKKERPEKEIEYTILKDEFIYSDLSLLTIAMENIIRNSIKYSLSDKVLYIEFNKTKINRKTFYYLKDNGIGFEDKFNDIIFRPFKRLHSEKDYPGFGIGLATVKRIFNKLHGEVFAKGNIGEGACFYFTFENLKQDSKS